MDDFDPDKDAVPLSPKARGNRMKTAKAPGPLVLESGPRQAAAAAPPAMNGTAKVVLPSGDGQKSGDRQKPTGHLQKDGLCPDIKGVGRSADLGSGPGVSPRWMKPSDSHGETE